MLAALLTLLIMEACSAQEREKGWRSDIDFLLKEMRQQHYIYKAQPLPSALQQQAQKLKAELPRLSDERLLVELQRLMVYLGDGHSYVLPWGDRRVQSKVLPLRFYLFSDGLFVIDAEKGYERWIGSRVVRFASTPADQAMAKMDELISRDNPMGIKWIGPLFLRFRGALEIVATGVSSQGKGIPVTLEDRDGRTAETEFELISVPPMRGVPKLIASKLPEAPTAPLYLENVTTSYWLKELPDAQAVYFQFNQVVNGSDETLAAFALRLQQFLEEKQPRKLIIDVRHNNGGNAELLQPLVDVLHDFETQYQQNRLYVMTGRNTFSAAQIFVARVDRLTNAIFAGEPSSSKPNFVGEENEIVLPWSGAIGSISNRYHESIPGDQRIWIEPELKVELSSQEYFANRDPVLDVVLQAPKS
jgi:hypothetical protein